MPTHSATRGKRRAFGQHFLRDQSTASRIANRAFEEALQTESQSLLEIGPGRGAITNPLLERLKHSPRPIEFFLCEKDEELAEFWRVKSQAAQVRVHVEEADFLELPDPRWGSGSLAVVSNLPYSSGTAILTRLASRPKRIRVMVLMFQAEVAQRLYAAPRTKDYGSLSVWVQNRWEVGKFLGVPPRAFSPPPKVDSEVVVLKPREAPLVETGQDPESLRLWDALLKQCFAHRRKMLRSGLPRTGNWQKALALSGVDGTKRAEALDWSDWQKLFSALRESFL